MKLFGVSFSSCRNNSRDDCNCSINAMRSCQRRTRSTVVQTIRLHHLVLQMIWTSRLENEHTEIFCHFCVLVLAGMETVEHFINSDNMSKTGLDFLMFSDFVSGIQRFSEHGIWVFRLGNPNSNVPVMYQFCV